MTAQELLACALNLPGARLTYPFGPAPACVKVCGRAFCELYPEERKITLKCAPSLAETLRGACPGDVVPGYHVPAAGKRYRNPVYLNRGVPDAEVLKMLDRSYAEVVRGLPRAAREALSQAEKPTQDASPGTYDKNSQ